MDIVLSDGRRVRLDQLATVRDTVAEQRSAALLNGRPVVGFEITRSRGAGEIDVANGVRAQLEKLKAEHPHIRITEAFNFVDPVQENFDGSMWLLIEGAILAVLVVWLFLRDWRATLVSAAALPLSILPTFGAMYFMGFTLNVVTLLSLSLVVGILVDDAIVEIENIMRHLRMRRAGARGRTFGRAGRSDDAGARRAEDAVPGRDGGRRRDRPRGHRHQLHADRGVPADRVHERRTGQVLRSVRLDRGDRGFLLAGRRADADADDGRLHPAHAEEGVPPAPLADDLPRLGAVVPEAPHRDPDRCCSLLLRLVRAGAAAADRFHSARRSVADAGLRHAAAGQHVQSDARRGRARARDRRKKPARQARLHRSRRRRRRLQPVRAARCCRSAQGHADDQHDAEIGSARRQQAGDRARPARSADGAAGRPHHRWARRWPGKIRAGARRRKRRSARRARAQGRTRAAHPRRRSVA